MASISEILVSELDWYLKPFYDDKIHYSIWISFECGSIEKVRI